jgi:hypothetical protein
MAGFVLAYHDSPWRCYLWIEVMPTETEFPLSSAYIVADLLNKKNIFLTAHRKEAGRF